MRNVEQCYCLLLADNTHSQLTLQRSHYSLAKSTPMRTSLKRARARARCPGDVSRGSTTPARLGSRATAWSGDRCSRLR